MLDEFARRVFEKFGSSKASKSALLLDKFARRGNSSLKLGTLLDSVNAPCRYQSVCESLYDFVQDLLPKDLGFSFSIIHPLQPSIIHPLQPFVNTFQNFFIPNSIAIHLWHQMVHRIVHRFVREFVSEKLLALGLM
jgi:hypothetical protein